MKETQPNSFRVIGYVTTAVTVENIPYDKLSHLNYAFLIPNSDGTFKTNINAWKLDQIVRGAKKHDVKVLISVGGWGYDTEFETLAATPERREVFIGYLTDFVSEHQLGGIDIDWEYPDHDSRWNFLDLIRELRGALPPEKLLTIAVASKGKNGEGIPAESFQYLDFINVMAYDGIEHASINHAQTALDYWLSRGVPKGKLVLGVPFYSRPIAVPYRSLVALDPGAVYLDEIDYQGDTIFYNGIPSIQIKTEIAMHRASGIMIWNLEHDTLDEETSLLNAIINVINQRE